MTPNRQLLIEAARQLGPLVEEVVFVGGATTEFFLTDPAAPPARSTLDVDCIVEVTTHAAYYALAGRLRTQGFQEDTTEGAPSCRWRHGALILDVMPTDASLLGFTNRWYRRAVATSMRVALSPLLSVRMVTPPLFVATKLEAFHGRGAADPMASRDLEDLVAIFDGRGELADELATADRDVQADIAEGLAVLLARADFDELVAAHLVGDLASQQRVSLIRERIRRSSASAA